MYNFRITKGTEGENHREQLVRDMIYVCLLPNLSEKNRREFINVSVAWSYTDRYITDINRSAKYKGCPFWSEKALERLENDGSWKKDGEKDKGLRHEHVVPRKIFVEAMLYHFNEVRKEIKDDGSNLEEIANREFIKINGIMNELLIGCVVTDDEAKKLDKDDMPNIAYKNGKPENDWLKFSEINYVWARYKKAKDTKDISPIFRLAWKFEGNRWKTDLSNKVEVDLKKYWSANNVSHN